jgi:hypothetical protein
MNILIFLISLGVFLIVVYWFFLVVGSFIARVPFVGTRVIAINQALNELNLDEHSILYDLGSGDGRIIKAAVSKTGCRAVGYEIAPLPFFISWFRLWKMRSRVKLHPTSFLNSSFIGVTHVFMYLSDAMMVQLEPVFDEKLPPGTMVVSCDYQFKNKTPIRVVDIVHDGVLSKKLFVYHW